MGRGRESYKKEACVRIAETWDGTPPVCVVTMCALFRPRDVLTVVSETRAPLARLDDGMKLSEVARYIATLRFHADQWELQYRVVVVTYGRSLLNLAPDGAARTSWTNVYGGDPAVVSTRGRVATPVVTNCQTERTLE